MAGKLYTKQTWVDEVLAGAVRYLLKDDAGNTVYEEASIELATGVITAGTAVTAATMQNIEDGIDDLDDLLVSLQSKFALDAATECNGRLTLESGVPVSTSDQSAKTTLYFTPYMGNIVTLYNTGTSAWDRHIFTEKSLSLAGYTANKNYDIWLYNNAGTLTLASTVWTDDTTRATALTTQDGIYVKTGALDYRYLGTIRINSTGGQTDDSRSKRYVWNYYNRVWKDLYAIEETSHTYTTVAYRAWNNNTTVGSTRVTFIIGVNEDACDFNYSVHADSEDGEFIDTGLGIDTTSAYINVATRFLLRNLNAEPIFVYAANPSYSAKLSAGYHYAQVLEYGNASSGQYYRMILSGRIFG